MKSAFVEGLEVFIAGLALGLMLITGMILQYSLDNPYNINVSIMIFIGMIVSVISIIAVINPK